MLKPKIDISKDVTENENLVKKGLVKRPTVKSFLTWLASVYFCFLLSGAFVVYLVKDRLALFPMQDAQWREFLPEMGPRLHLETKEVVIPGPHNSKLAGLLIKKPGAKYIYFVSHGNGGNLGYRLNLAAYLTATGQSVFMYDYEGFGSSTGSASLANLVPDALSAYDYLTTKEGYKPDQIILYGESIGTGVTGSIMKERPSRAVILQSGFPSFMTAAKDRLWQLKIFPDWALPEPHFDTLSVVQGKHPPLLFMHGVLDQTLPVQYSREMYKLASEPKLYYEVPKAGHNDVPEVDAEGFRNQLNTFIASFEKTK